MDNIVGVVGLGIMGGAIARSLTASGWRVIGFDPDKHRQEEAARNGVGVRSTLASLIADADVVLTSLASPSALHSTVEALASATSTRRTVIETSTLSLPDKLKAKQALDSSGHTVLDCPVSGTGAQAIVKDLVVYASGDPQTVANLRQLFLSFSRAVYDVGEFGNGSRVKFVANLLVAINNVASAEAMVLAQRAGLDLAKVVGWISAGAGSSRVFEYRAPLMAGGRYAPASMKLAVWQKDLDIITSFARDLGAPTPLFSATLPVYAAAVSSRSGDDDTASVCAVLEELAAAMPAGKSDVDPPLRRRQ